MKFLVPNFIFPLLLLVGPSVSFSAEIASMVQCGTLVPGASAETNPFYRKVVESIGKPLLFEKAKILYLIGQVRRSPCELERHGEIFSGSKAASYLLRKFRVEGDTIETVEQFIQYQASKSSAAGEFYYVVGPRREKREMQTVLMNELFLLNQALRESDLRGIRYRIIHPGKESAV